MLENNNKRIQPLKVSPLSDYQILENKFSSTQIKPFAINIKSLPKITTMNSNKADFNSRELIKESIKNTSKDVILMTFNNISNC